MEFNSTKAVSAVLFVVACIGVVAFSQGLSFARWNDFMPASHFVNFHAILISSLGLGLLLSASGIRALMLRIGELEKTVDRLKDEGK